MAFDGLVMHAVVHELQQCVGGKIYKIHQPSNQDLMLTIRSRGVSKKLILSANPTYPRLHLTTQSSLNPMEAPMFCMLLRKYCENGVIESIEQVQMERITHIQIKQRDEIGDLQMKRIIVEIMGRHSNIILVDASDLTIIEAIHRVTPAISSHRLIVPGRKYMPPPDQFKQNPLHASEEEVLSLISGVSKQEIPNILVNAYEGISPLVANDIVNSINITDTAAAHLIANTFVKLMQQIKHHEYHPTLISQSEGNGKSIFSVYSLKSHTGLKTSYTSTNECLDDYYGIKAERDLIKQKTADIHRLIVNEKVKNERKIIKLQEEQQEAMQAEHYRMMGELIHSHLHSVVRGIEAIEVTNYYDDHQRQITIPLDPLLSPLDNAQRYFKKYQKFKNSPIAIQVQLQQAKEEIRYLESLLFQLEGASLEDIKEIRSELVTGGYLKEKAIQNPKIRKDHKTQIHKFTSSEGVSILVGKNNMQNDYITNHIAHASDTWLHTKDIPGSHVVIRAASFSEQTLKEAAMLAAYYSKAKQSSNVPVDYTLIRHVSKPKGAKPGYVIYDKQRTVFVTPEEHLIKQLQIVKESFERLK
jgi:predicted ribosome quality control (RQC) complex YloA/Tae2 family protein